MNIENLKIFSDLVDNGSFSKAARINGVTQSAVSQQVKAMEKQFHITIVDRSHKLFKLTPGGERFYKGAMDLLRRYQQLSSDLLEMKKEISGMIHISTVYSIGLHELPVYVKNFLKEFPTVNIRVEYRRANLVYEDVLKSSADLGLVAFPVKMRNLEVIPFRQDKLVLVCHPDHPLAKRKTIRVETLDGERFISFDSDIPTQKAINRILRKARVKANTAMEFDNVETLKRAVEINAGIAIIPQATVAQEVGQGLLETVELKGKEFRRPLAILLRKGKILTPAIKKFIASLRRRQPSRKRKKAVEKKK